MVILLDYAESSDERKTTSSRGTDNPSIVSPAEFLLVCCNGCDLVEQIEVQKSNKQITKIIGISNQAKPIDVELAMCTASLNYKVSDQKEIAVREHAGRRVRT